MYPTHNEMITKFDSEYPEADDCGTILEIPYDSTKVPHVGWVAYPLATVRDLEFQTLSQVFVGCSRAKSSICSVQKAKRYLKAENNITRLGWSITLSVFSMFTRKK